MAPLLRLAYLDETEYWDRKIRRAAGRIAGVYLYDKHLHVHCCELTPSYELSLIGYLTELPVTDSVQMAMAETVEFGSVTYVHVQEIDALPCRRRRPGWRDLDPFRIGRVSCTTNLPLPFKGDHDQVIADALEYLHANGVTTT